MDALVNTTLQANPSKVKWRDKHTPRIGSCQSPLKGYRADRLVERSGTKRGAGRACGRAIKTTRPWFGFGCSLAVCCAIKQCCTGRQAAGLRSPTR
ncbi:hypothetical protein BCR44DRAFT_1437167 [Catenaria anguillulae PL171]|uniref:Uncharacterized protein n=1 Tax=Catenaria anguillulae PL171 TaxID=765915 RepID=A0A1Y2HJV6_9FUNG|nr:hypothetical protein BCR44DRAFT_1437167 [Catenaria anguillulae PL171]